MGIVSEKKSRENLLKKTHEESPGPGEISERSPEENPHGTQANGHTLDPIRKASKPKTECT